MVTTATLFDSRRRARVYETPIGDGTRKTLSADVRSLFFLQTRLLTSASFRAPLSYRITTAYATNDNRAGLLPRETDYLWPKVRKFSKVRHAQNYARGDRISREKGSTYNTIQTTWKRLAARAKNKPAEIYRDGNCDRRHGLSSGIKRTWSVPKGVSWPQKEEVLQANPKYTCGGEKSES